MNKKYQLISMAEAAARGLKAPDGSSLVLASPLLPPTKLNIPAIRFGHLDPAAIGPLRESPPAWSAGRELQIRPLYSFVVQNAVVHTRWGIITAGEYLFRDTLYHVPLHLIPETGDTGDGGFNLIDLPVTGKYNGAIHLLTGELNNYYHWLMDLVARIEPESYGRNLKFPCLPGPLLVPGAWRDLQPSPPHEYQTASLDLLLHPNATRRGMSPPECVFVKYLNYMPRAGGAFDPNPSVLAIFDELRRAVLGDQPRPGNNRKLYLSRREVTGRRMTNEPAIIEMVQAAGYEIVNPGALSFADQITLFDHASHIIAPHGAALTNILFCRPGTVVCELHMDSYVQWAMRCLAALRQLDYGCLIGHANEPWQKWPHVNSWTCPVEELREILKAQG